MTPEQFTVAFIIVVALAISACVIFALTLPTVKAAPAAKPARPRSTKAPVKGDLLRPKEVSKILGIPVSTLATMRDNGKGPAWFRDGKPIYYKRADVEAWMVERAKANDVTEQARGLLGLVDQNRDNSEFAPERT